MQARMNFAAVDDVTDINAVLQHGCEHALAERDAPDRSAIAILANLGAIATGR